MIYMIIMTNKKLIMLIHLKKIITNHDREYIYIAAVYNIK
jgi:hypothetical protein